MVRLVDDGRSSLRVRSATGFGSLLLACSRLRGRRASDNHVDFRDIQADGVKGSVSSCWYRRGGKFSKLASL